MTKKKKVIIAVAVLAANRAVEERKTIYFKPEDFKVS